VELRSWKRHLAEGASRADVFYLKRYPWADVVRLEGVHDMIVVLTTRFAMTAEARQAHNDFGRTVCAAVGAIPKSDVLVSMQF
jgi:hypothetical protein